MELYQAETLAKNLMKEHNLSNNILCGKTTIANSWNFKFNNRVKIGVGRCEYNTKTLSLSKPLTKINNIEFVKETMLHEIAHALCGSGIGHSKVWKKKCIELGIKPERFINPDVKLPKAKYTIECPNCHKQTPRYRKCKDNIACGICCKKYNNNKYTDRFKMVYVK